MNFSRVVRHIDGQESFCLQLSAVFKRTITIITMMASTATTPRTSMAIHMTTATTMRTVNIATMTMCTTSTATMAIITTMMTT